MCISDLQNHDNFMIDRKRSLNLATWNVMGIMSSAASLDYLLQHYNIDAAFITEHKLFDHMRYFIDSINTQNDNFTTCNMEMDIYGNTRCGKGGVSIIFKKSLNFTIRHLNEICDERILGIEVNCSNNNNNNLLIIYCFLYLHAFSKLHE